MADGRRKKRALLCLLLLPVLALLHGRDIPAIRNQEIETPGYIALTFDDSPNGKTTERLLDGLQARGAKATFFLIGKQISGQEALVKRMAAEGHQVGNHTWTHRRLDNTGVVGEQELEHTEAALHELLGASGYWIRPPWGFASAETLRETSVPLIYWSLDTEDWKTQDADRIAKIILEQAENGDIVLLHDFYDTSVDGALKAIDLLQERGYQFVTLGELFEKMGVEPESGCLYCRPDRFRPVV